MSRPDSGARRLISTVAWLYHTRGLRQSAIAERLNLSQSRVSRLLEQAATMDIVRTVVVLPVGEQSEVEGRLESVFGLSRATVYDIGAVPDEAELAKELGQLLALQLQSDPWNARVVGFTSWSRALQEMVDHLRPVQAAGVEWVVELLGDLGPPALQHRAAQHTQRLATLLGAQPDFLRVPGVAPSMEVRDQLMAHDVHAQAVLKRLDTVDFALIGIGPVDIVAPLRAGDNFLTTKHIAQVRARGAVGEVNLRYLTAGGDLVPTDVDDLIIGATTAQLRSPARRLSQDRQPPPGQSRSAKPLVWGCCRRSSIRSDQIRLVAAAVAIVR